MTGRLGWLVRARRPAELLDQVIVTDELDRSIAGRPLAIGSGEVARDVALRQLGYDRVSEWEEQDFGFRCEVKPR